MGVRLVTHFAKVWLVRRVNVHVFLSVTAVCKPSVTALKFTLKRLFSCRKKEYKKTIAFVTDIRTLFGIK